MSAQYSSKSLKVLGELPSKIREQIIRRADALADDPWPVGFKKLQGQADAIFRVKQGGYRILYVVRGPQVFIIDIKPRNEAYRRR